MKKITNIIWGMWCAFTTLISPVWLTMIFLNITGMIYKYDYSMDEGSGTECNPYEHEWAGYTNQFYEEV